MIHLLQDSFKKIASLILLEDKTLEQWAEIEADDMFQEGNYVGGFDATEMEFCFSVYINDQEFWFQIPIEKIKLIESGEIREVEVVEKNYFSASSSN